MEKTAVSTENSNVNVINIDRSQTKASLLNNKIVTFVNIDNDFNCVICMQVSDEPVRCNGMCAGIFCDVCMKECLAHIKKCPSCNLKDITAKKDVLVRNQIMKHQVFCINSSNTTNQDQATSRKRKASSDVKCSWTGRYDELSTHLKQCEFEMTVCTNDGCEEKIERRDLGLHLQACIHRTINCVHCMIFVKATKNAVHLNQCPKLEIICKCRSKLPREKMDEHRNKHCPLTEIECEVIGCNAKVMRKDYLKHQDNAAKEHVRLLSAVVQRLNSTVGPNPSQIKWRLANIAAKKQEGRFVIKNYNSPAFEVKFSGSIKLYISAYINGNQLELFLNRVIDHSDILSNKSILNIGGTSIDISKVGQPCSKYYYSDDCFLRNCSNGIGWSIADITRYIDNDGFNITLNLQLKMANEPLVLK